MKSLIEKIIAIRKKKGYSHEYMGYKLNISQVAYSKIEKGETRLSVERLYRIGQILSVAVDIKLEEN